MNYFYLVGFFNEIDIKLSEGNKFNFSSYLFVAFDWKRKNLERANLSVFSLNISIVFRVFCFKFAAFP